MLKLSRQYHREKRESRGYENRFHIELVEVQTLTLDAALLICQELHICLIANNYKLIIYHPGVVVPRRVTQVIRTNQQEVLRRIGYNHVSVCPSPALHAHSWHYTVKRDCCDICARLNHWMDKCA